MTSWSGFTKELMSVEGADSCGVDSQKSWRLYTGLTKEVLRADVWGVNL